MRNNLELSEDSFLKITYSFLAGGFVILFGFAAWMTSVELNAKTLDRDVHEMQEKQAEVQNVLQSIDKRLYRIEMLLEQIKKEK